MKALLITHVASIGLYLAAATLFVSTGTFELTAIATLDEPTKLIVFGGILFAAWGNQLNYRYKLGYLMQWKLQPL